MYDLIQAVLLEVVRETEPVSAEPITTIIRHSLDDVQIMQLIDYRSLPKSRAFDEQRDAGHRRLLELIQRAGTKHFDDLRSRGLVDVDIIAKCAGSKIWSLDNQLRRDSQAAV